MLLILKGVFMIEDERNTVVVEKERSNPLGWIIGAIVILILLAIFFSYGGFGLFNGGTPQGGGSTVNVDTPDTVNVQQPYGK
jgi:hypothetical protein